MNYLWYQIMGKSESTLPIGRLDSGSPFSRVPHLSVLILKPILKGAPHERCTIDFMTKFVVYFFFYCLHSSINWLSLWLGTNNYNYIEFHFWRKWFDTQKCLWFHSEICIKMTLELHFFDCLESFFQKKHLTYLICTIA